MQASNDPASHRYHFLPNHVRHTEMDTISPAEPVSLSQCLNNYVRCN